MTLLRIVRINGFVLSDGVFQVSIVGGMKMSSRFIAVLAVSLVEAPHEYP